MSSLPTTEWVSIEAELGPSISALLAVRANLTNAIASANATGTVLNTTLWTAIINDAAGNQCVALRCHVLYCAVSLVRPDRCALCCAVLCCVQGDRQAAHRPAPQHRARAQQR